MIDFLKKYAPIITNKISEDHDRSMNLIKVIEFEKSEQEFIFNEIFEISLKVNIDIFQITKLYSSFRTATNSIGLDPRSAIIATMVVVNTLNLCAASDCFDDVVAAIRTSILRGYFKIEEYNVIIENIPIIHHLISEFNGMSSVEFRGFVSNGKLKANNFILNLINVSPKIFRLSNKI